MPGATRSRPTRARRPRTATTAVPTRLVEDLKAVESTMLRGLAHDAQQARDEAIRTTDLGKLAAVQIEWAAEQGARAALAWSGWCSALFDVQAICWRDTERCARAGLEPWLAAVRRPLPVDAVLETPDDLSPQALVQRATTAWLVIGNAWMAALRHDLEAPDEKPVTGAARNGAGGLT